LSGKSLIVSGIASVKAEARQVDGLLVN
jgi:hypothetical protein